MKISSRALSVCILAAVLSLAAMPASAATIYWTNWTSQAPGLPGAAVGTIALPSGNLAVTYSGEVISVGDQGDWNFPGTYTLSGVVDNVPSPFHVSVPMYGYDARLINTISFSPVMSVGPMSLSQCATRRARTAPASSRRYTGLTSQRHADLGEGSKRRSVRAQA